MNEGQRGQERPREWIGERGSEALVVGKLSLNFCFSRTCLMFLPLPLRISVPDWHRLPSESRRGTVGYFKVSP